MKFEWEIIRFWKQLATNPYGTNAYILNANKFKNTGPEKDKLKVP